MPLEGDHAGDIGLETPEGLVCRFDVEGGQIKDPKAIFEGGVAYFIESAADGDRDLAERLTRKNMSTLPHWQANPFPELEGPMATDEEFETAMSKIA